MPASVPEALSFDAGPTFRPFSDKIFWHAAMGRTPGDIKHGAECLIFTDNLRVHPAARVICGDYVPMADHD